MAGCTQQQYPEVLAFVGICSMVTWHHTLQPHCLTIGILFSITVVKWATVDGSWDVRVQVAGGKTAVQNYKVIHEELSHTHTHTHS